jgi:hypothetical protein
MKLSKSLILYLDDIHITSGSVHQEIFVNISSVIKIHQLSDRIDIQIDRYVISTRMDRMYLVKCVKVM